MSCISKNWNTQMDPSVWNDRYSFAGWVRNQSVSSGMAPHWQGNARNTHCVIEDEDLLKHRPPISVLQKRSHLLFLICFSPFLSAVSMWASPFSLHSHLALLWERRHNSEQHVAPSQLPPSTPRRVQPSRCSHSAPRGWLRGKGVSSRLWNHWPSVLLLILKARDSESWNFRFKAGAFSKSFKDVWINHLLPNDVYWRPLQISWSNHNVKQKSMLAFLHRCHQTYCVLIYAVHWGFLSVLAH